tara:strand:- start:280 stop:1047 length:768 start_codon:yes stop_codon:yes gene_type:complete
MKPQSGNALFLILIAVALFAALSYAVTNSGRGGGGIDREQAEILAAEMTQYTSLMKSGVDRLMLINGCDDNEISFYTGTYPHHVGYYFPHASAADINNNCNLYHPDGGGMTPQLVPEGFQRLDAFTSNPHIFTMTYLPLRTYIPDIGRNYTSSSDFEASELVVAAPMLSEEVCLAIDRGLGVENTGGAPPTNASFRGNNLSSSCDLSINRTCSIIDRAYGIPEIVGKSAACIYNPNNSAHISSPRYIYYHVLIPG